jgi:hypothetical protein
LAGGARGSSGGAFGSFGVAFTGFVPTRTTRVSPLYDVVQVSVRITVPSAA